MRLTQPLKAISSGSGGTVAATDALQVDAHRVYTVFVVNTSGSTRYAQLFDRATAASDTTVPFTQATLTSGSSASFVWPRGRPMEHGLHVASSSTSGSLTLASTDLIIDVTYD